MELIKDEEIMLLLYAEVYNRAYDVNDSEVVMEGYKKNHLEMQRVCCMLGPVISRVAVDYVLTDIGPNSAVIESFITTLDQKETAITAFYDQVEQQRQEILEKVFGYKTADMVSNIGIILSTIDNLEEALEIMTMYTYIANHLKEEATFWEADQLYKTKISKEGYNTSDFLDRQTYWKLLSTFGLVNKMDRKLTRHKNINA